MTSEFFRKKLKKPLIYSEALNAINSAGRDFFTTSVVTELTVVPDLPGSASQFLPVG